MNGACDVHRVVGHRFSLISLLFLLSQEDCGLEGNQRVETVGTEVHSILVTERERERDKNERWAHEGRQLERGREKEKERLKTALSSCLISLSCLLLSLSLSSFAVRRLFLFSISFAYSDWRTFSIQMRQPYSRYSSLRRVTKSTRDLAS